MDRLKADNPPRSRYTTARQQFGDEFRALTWLGRLTLLLQTLALIGILLSLLLFLPESVWSNWRFNLRSDMPVHSDLVVIGIDDQYLARVPEVKQIPYDYLAQLIEKVAQFEPSVIGVDVRFTNADTGRTGYNRLLSAVGKAGPIIFPSVLTKHGDGFFEALQPPAPAKPGHVSLMPAPRFQLKTAGYRTTPVIADAPLLTPLADGTSAPSFAYALATTHDQATRQSGTTPTWVGQDVLPINYFGRVTREDGVQYFSSEPFLTTDFSGLEHAFAQKIVVIGVLFDDPENRDTFLSPFGAVRGAEVHINALNTLLAERYVAVPLNGWPTYLLMAVFFWIGWSVWQLKPSRALSMFAGVFVTWLMVGWICFVGFDVMVQMALPLWGLLSGCMLGYIFWTRRSPGTVEPLPPVRRSSLHWKAQYLRRHAGRR